MLLYSVLISPAPGTAANLPAGLDADLSQVFLSSLPFFFPS